MRKRDKKKINGKKVIVTNNEISDCKDGKDSLEEGQ